jgi:hypothetical protein
MTMLSGTDAVSQQKDYAPLPEKIVAAKTVFLVNDSGSTKLGDAVYRQLRDWVIGRS